jgi:hypothetical protein
VIETREGRPVLIFPDGTSLPAEFGLATIWDWDLIIFAASHLNQAIEDGRKPARRISFVPYDCMKQIRRPIGGEHYKKLAEAIRRLRATTIITNIRFEDAVGEDDDTVLGEERPFSWLTSYRLPKKYRRRVYRTPDTLQKAYPSASGPARCSDKRALADKNEERTWQLPRLHHARLPDFARRISATLPG